MYRNTVDPWRLRLAWAPDLGEVYEGLVGSRRRNDRKRHELLGQVLRPHATRLVVLSEDEGYQQSCAAAEANGIPQKIVAAVICYGLRGDRGMRTQATQLQSTEAPFHNMAATYRDDLRTLLGESRTEPRRPLRLYPEHEGALLAGAVTYQSGEYYRHVLYVPHQLGEILAASSIESTTPNTVEYAARLALDGVIAAAAQS